VEDLCRGLSKFSRVPVTEFHDVHRAHIQQKRIPCLRNQDLRKMILGLVFSLVSCVGVVGNVCRDKTSFLRRELGRNVRAFGAMIIAGVLTYSEGELH
jgi:hypothetical protein